MALTLNYLFCFQTKIKGGKGEYVAEELGFTSKASGLKPLGAYEGKLEEFGNLCLNISLPFKLRKKEKKKRKEKRIKESLKNICSHPPAEHVAAVGLKLAEYVEQKIAHTRARHMANES